MIYVKMKNDVSFILDGNLPLWEHQSSINPNTPVRGLMYFGNLYDQYIKNNKLNIYGKKLQKIPTPQYIVFYNGEDDCESVEKIRLSDAFINEDKSGDFEWTATVDSCIAEGIMEDFLVKHKSEVLSVCITEFDEKVYTDGIREEGREEGRKEDIINMLRKNKTPEQIAEFCGYDLEYVKAIQKEMGI